jgi:hypothetical protein
LSWKVGTVVVLAAVGAVVVLTRPGNGKTAYVHRNEALLASLPVFPGAVKVRQASSPRDSNCRPSGYGTIVDYQVPKGTRAMAVVRFYAARLRRRGWHGSIHSEPVFGAAPFRKLGKNRGVGFVGGSPLRKIGKSLGVAFVRGDASVNIGTDDMVILTDRPLHDQHIVWRYSIGIDYRGALVHCAED